MTRIRSYHRPSRIEDALALLDRPGVTTAPIGGGTVIGGLPDDPPEEVVDLQALGLDAISRDGATLTFGAMTRLQDVIDHEWTPPALRDLARRSAPSTIRNAATVGGTIAAADWENVFLAGLVAWDATVAIATTDARSTRRVADVLTDQSPPAGALITAISVDVSGAGASAGTGRTPADIPIVLVAGHRGDAGDITLAATGLAATPITIDLDRIDDLDPPGDFRGTPEYRRHLAATLASRVVAALAAGGEG